MLSLSVVFLFSLHHVQFSQLPSLRSDPKLQVKVTIVEINPELAAVFEKFETATDLKFTVDKRIDGHRPKLGSFQFRNTPVFAVMGVLPKIGLEEGRWEKTSNGYMLTGKTSSSLIEAKLTPNAPRDYFLRKDPRLRAKLVFDKQPLLRTVLQKLGEATGLRFEVAENLQNHEPAWDMVNLRETPAWMVMGVAAEAQLQNGTWEKTEKGYRLTGIPHHPTRRGKPPETILDARERTSRLPQSVILLSILVVSLVGLSVSVWRRAKRVGNKVP